MNQIYYDAIYASYPNAVTINSDSIVFDSDNNVINIDENFISNKISELEAAEPIRLLREKRDQLLSQSDWRDLPSYPGSNQEAWRTYRQQLRDMPSTTDPSDPTWPTAPEND